MNKLETIRKEIQKYHNILRLTKEESLNLIGSKHGYKHYESFYKVVTGERLTLDSEKNEKKLQSILDDYKKVNESRQNNL
ncbi:hypothetical protein [Christiangramia crocea]|uniref:Uncharacterized protein n=1 Tax=Christiangramia crocea TaxID=2904124 RepID=A0A9X1UV83_9FLAO|nr:hypothetical protein [Gramella crocea]MCG9971032.1 hypothetical protein [Gramella crocea]